jgi:homoserine O-acetyltransferase
MAEDDTQSGSVGRVDTQVATIVLPPEGMPLTRGGALTELQVAYETYGQLNAERDNVIFICHALTGEAHAAGLSADGTPGWWDRMIGPGKGIDTRYYHVVCANILGGCKGTTGPASINPSTAKPYASAFPAITVSDIVDTHRRLCDHLGIARLAGLIGASFGGMQVMDWMIRYPDTVSHAVAVASAPSLSTQALAFDTLARNAITADPAWHDGDYYDTGSSPDIGLAQARQLGHITYISQEMLSRKFGRDRRGKDETRIEPLVPHEFQSNFQIESYLEYKGQQFVERFDANSYLHVTRAMDEFDLCEHYGSLEKAFAAVTSRVLIVAVSSDWLFPPEQSRAVAQALLRNGHRVSYCELKAPHGHDAFLIDVSHLSEAMRAFLPWIVTPADDGAPVSPPPACSDSLRQLHEGIVSMVPPASRLLDIGCGRGEMLDLLAAQRGTHGVGVDIDIEQTIHVIDRGHSVFQLDVDRGLAIIPDVCYV